MKKKISIDEAKLALQEVEVTGEKINEFEDFVVKTLLTGEEKEKGPKVAKEYVVLFPKNSDENLIPSEGTFGWVLQILEGDSPSDVPAKVIAAANDFNGSRKGRKCPVNTVGEALESVPARFFKPHGVWVKTKIPVFGGFISNKLEG